MALFKISKGNSLNLPKTYTAGYCYFCEDTGLFYIDTTNDETGRKILNAQDAATLCGVSLETLQNSINTKAGITFKTWTASDVKES